VAIESHGVRRRAYELKAWRRADSLADAHFTGWLVLRVVALCDAGAGAGAAGRDVVEVTTEKYMVNPFSTVAWGWALIVTYRRSAETTPRTCKEVPVPTTPTIGWYPTAEAGGAGVAGEAGWLAG
jgi:hypothetical protein